jgi:hypothetical protein
MQQKPSKRKYTVTDKVRASVRLNLEKARAVGNKILYRPTDKRLDTCRSNLEKARESPNYKPFVRHGLRTVDLRRSAPQVGESQEELDRFLERVQGVVQAITGRERNAVQGLAQALWRRQRVFTSRVHWETLRFYLRLLEAAFGLADLRSPIADCPPSLPDQSTIDNHPSAIRAAVRQLAEVTWQRLQVFCRQAEKEAALLRETLEKAEAGTLPRPKTLVEYVKAIRDRHRARDWNATDAAPALGEETAAVNETGRVPYVETPGEPEAKWWAEHLIWVFIYCEAGRAYQEAAALNRRVEEAFRGLEAAVEAALPPLEHQ